MIPYSVMTQKVLRNGKERKLTPTQRVAVGAVYSFSTEERSADFTCRELAERYRVSESSAFRSLKAARDVGLIKRADKVSDYDFEGTDDGGHLRVREWAYYAKFEFSNGKAEYLIHNEILVLFYIISQCRGKKGADIWRASLRHISCRLNLSPTTVSSAVARLKSARLIYVSGRAKNKNSRATFSVNQEAVKAAEEAVKTRYKGQAESVKEADERAAREQYFAHYHAAAIERAEQMSARARADEA